MNANDARSIAVTRHGAYLCLKAPLGGQWSGAGRAVHALADGLGFENEFDAVGGHPVQAIAFLRRAGATPAHITDNELLNADAVVHLASATDGPINQFCADMERLLGSTVSSRILRGVVRPTNYTGNAMHDFAYGNQVAQQPGPAMPHSFLMPMSKSSHWWDMDWMKRHTYFLPRYDDAGSMLNEGHVLAASAGISCLMRRTYKQPTEPAFAGAYDFINYFECANEHVSSFHDVCAALRNVARNPEWKYVHEGPTWHGRRVATWTELFE